MSAPSSEPGTTGAWQSHTKPSAASNDACCRECEIAVRQHALAAAYRRIYRLQWLLTVLFAAAGVFVMACTPKSHHAAAVAAQTKRDWTTACEHWRIAALENPTPHAFVQQATCEYELGLHNAALETCERFRYTHPVRYHQVRGIVHLKSGRPNDAAIEFHQMTAMAQNETDRSMAVDLLRACK